MSTNNLTIFKKYIDSLPLNISVRFIRPFVRLIRLLLRLVVAFIYTPFAGIFWLLNIKFPDFFVERIGHLMVEPDCFLKEQLLKTGRIPRAIMLAPKSKSANQAAVRYWSKYFIVVDNSILASMLKPLQVHPWTKFKTFRYAVAMYQTADVYRINANWGSRPPLLKLKPCDIERGNDVLKIMGIPDGAWYVCVHAREGKFSLHDESLHSYRNVSIADFEKSMAFIVSQGGYCIRMGDSTMVPAPNLPGVIDYALSAHKQDWMDLFLAAKCKFFLGSNSGAYAMATVFGRPSAVVGIAPLTALPFGVNDLGIPMLYKSDELDQILTFKKIIESPLSTYRLTEEYEKAGISLVKNLSDEILDLTIEQLERVQGKYSIDEGYESREAQFKSMLKLGHYCYGTASRVGGAFLAKYQHLLN
jgi:putative glycosyltransferase (TIGR04372 family)